MAEKLAKDSHDTWAWKKRMELEELGMKIRYFVIQPQKEKKNILSYMV